MTTMTLENETFTDDLHDLSSDAARTLRDKIQTGVCVVAALSLDLSSQSCIRALSQIIMHMHNIIHVDHTK